MKEQIIYRKVSELKNNERNPRKNDDAVDSVAKSIEKYGFRNPLIIDENNVVWCGNTRLKASRKLGLEEVPCIIVSDLTEQQMAELALLDNKTNEIAEWDFEMLGDILKDVELDDFDLDWGIDEQLGIEQEVEEDNFEVELPEKPKAKYGDIYQLGEHRLMCGDSTKEEDVAKLMNGEKADMVFTDPPYNMSNNFDTSTINLKKLQKRVDNIVNFNPDEISYLTQLDICTFYIFTSKNLVPRYFEIFKDFDFNILVWCKDNPTPLTNYTFLPDVEYLLYFSKKGKIWNNGLDTNIYKKYYNGNKLEGRKESGDVHPTVKPQKIIQDKIRISSNKNGIVLDVFGGSGSTLIACEQLNRKCYMMELDEHYISVIIERYINFTGNDVYRINPDGTKTNWKEIIA